MKLSWHLVAQFALIIVQYGNLASNYVPVAYQPYVAFVVGVAQLGLHVFAHNQLPPNMAAQVGGKALKIVALFVGLFLAVGVAKAQTAPPAPQAPIVLPATSTFSLSANVLQIGNLTSGSTAAADFGGLLQITNNAYLRQENILAPSASWQGFFGGVNYVPGFFVKELAKTKLSPQQFQPYFTGSIGVGINSQNGKTTQKLGELFGGGVNYSPTANGKFTVNLIELRYAHLPGFNSSTVVASVGVKLGW